MKRIIATAIAAAMTIISMPFSVNANAEILVSKNFDFGGLGTADRYIGVSASEGYNSAKGYGFENTGAVENVKASGTGALYLLSVPFKRIKASYCKV